MRWKQVGNDDLKRFLLLLAQISVVEVIQLVVVAIVFLYKHENHNEQPVCGIFERGTFASYVKADIKCNLCDCNNKNFREIEDADN